MPPPPHPVPRVRWARAGSPTHGPGRARPRLPQRPVIWVISLLVAGLLGPGLSGPALVGSSLVGSSLVGSSLVGSSLVGSGHTSAGLSDSAVTSVAASTPTDAITTRWALPSRAEGVLHRGDQTTRPIGPQPRVDPTLGLTAAAVLLAATLVVTVPRPSTTRGRRRLAPGRGPGPRGPPVTGPSGPPPVEEPPTAARPTGLPLLPRSAPVEVGLVALG